MALPWNREKTISPLLGIVLLLLAFVMLYEPWRLGARELFRMEGFYAAQTTEISWRSPVVTAHGTVLQNSFPLFPLLSSAVQNISGLPVEHAMRLVSVFMTFFMALLIYITAGLARNRIAAQAAAAMFISCNIVIEKSLDAYPASCAAFGLLAAHLLWFYFGAQRSNWNMAWISSCAVMSLTFFAGGFRALLIFAFPLIFMRRPLTVWSKLKKPGFWLGGIILALAVMVWMIPYLSSSISTAGGEDLHASFSGYPEQLLSVPWDCIIRFLPWSVIAWAPFCVAIQGLDDTPIFSRYLRTLVIAVFFLLWLMPGTGSSDLFFLAGPLSIITGLYYETAVRRYAGPIRFMLKGCILFCIVSAVSILLFCTLPSAWLDLGFISISYPVAFRHQPVYLYSAAGAIAGVCIITAFLWADRKHAPVWLMLMLTSVCGGLFFWSVMYSYRTQNTEKRTLGAELRQALQQGSAGDAMPQILYKSNIQDLYGECYYMGIPVKKINGLNELPDSEKTVYLLTTEFPMHPKRNWISLLPPEHTYKGRRIRLLRGELRDSSQQIQANDW